MIKKTQFSLGFTLLEIMVALLLTGIIFSILFGVYGQTLDVAEEVEQEQERMRMLRLGTERIRLDLQGVVSPPQDPGEENATQGDQSQPPVFLIRDVAHLSEEDPVLMTFYTLNMLEFSDRFPRREAVRVAYLVRDRILIRRQSLFPGLAGEWPEQEVELAEDVQNVRLSCTGPDGELLSSWPPEGEDLPPVPGVIRFSLVQGREGESPRKNMFTVRPQWWGERDDRKSEPGT